jgi:hypothetical protein
MGKKSAMLVATERLLSLARECPDHDSIDSYSEILGNLHDAIQRLEDFRQRNSTLRICPQDCIG